MTKVDKSQNADQRPKKYLWFGYGNYGGGHPNNQIGGGNVRDPHLLGEFSKNARSCFIIAISGLVGLMTLALLLAWGMSLLAR